MAFGEDSPPCSPREPSMSALYLWGYNLKGQTSHKAGVSGDPRTWKCQRAPLQVPRGCFRGKSGRQVVVVDVACGVEHTAAVGDDGSLFTWGSNEYGQLGDGTEDDRRDPHLVRGLKNETVTSAACGAYCTAVISNKKNAKAAARQLAVKDATTGSGGSGDGGSVNCASEFPATGRLWVWGQHQKSNHPRLLRGAFPPQTVIIQVACGDTHAAAVSREGLLQTWGYNEWGQLGHGRICDGLQSPRLVRHFLRHVDEGACDEGRVVVTQVACGGMHTAAVDDWGDIFTWGCGVMGQLGHRSLQSRSGTCELFPRRVAALESQPVRQLACGRTHTVAVTTKNALYIWGGGRDGQLGAGNVSASAPSSSSTAAVATVSGTILPRPIVTSSSSSSSSLSLAHSLHQRLPLLLLPRGVHQVACGQDHTLAATLDGRVVGWGYNSCGQAATGRQSFVWAPTEVNWCVGDIHRLAAGGGHSAVLTHATSLKHLCEFRLAENMLPLSLSPPLTLSLTKPALPATTYPHTHPTLHSPLVARSENMRGSTGNSSSSSNMQVCSREPLDTVDGMEVEEEVEMGPVPAAGAPAGGGKKEGEPSLHDFPHSHPLSNPHSLSHPLSAAASVIEVGHRLGADSLVRFCHELRGHVLNGTDPDLDSFLPVDKHRGSGVGGASSANGSSSSGAISITFPGSHSHSHAASHVDGHPIRG